MHAHDYWLAPEKFRASANEKVAVRLFVGESLVSEEERAFEKAKVTSIDLWTSSGKTSSPQSAMIENQKPFLTIDLAKTSLLALVREPQKITLEAAKFERYLREEGLDAIVDSRRTRNESMMAGRETYTRYLKSLVRVGDAPDPVAKKTIGHALEIVLDTDPATATWSSDLFAHVVFEGKPLAGVQVEAFFEQSDGRVTQKARTAPNGSVRFVAFPGKWLLRLVHMRRCDAGPSAGGNQKCADTDWESFWTSYSFDVR